MITKYVVSISFSDRTYFVKAGNHFRTYGGRIKLTQNLGEAFKFTREKDATARLDAALERLNVTSPYQNKRYGVDENALSRLGYSGGEITGKVLKVLVDPSHGATTIVEEG